MTQSFYFQNNIIRLNFLFKTYDKKGTFIIRLWSSKVMIYLSSKAKDVSEFVCSLTPSKRRTLMSWNFKGWLPLGANGFRLKNVRIGPTVRRKTVKNANDTSDNPAYHLILLISNFSPTWITLLLCIVVLEVIRIVVWSAVNNTKETYFIFLLAKPLWT